LKHLWDTNAILYRESVTITPSRSQQSLFGVFGHSTKRLKNEWDTQQILGGTRFRILGNLDVFGVVFSRVELSFCCLPDVLSLKGTRNSHIETGSFSFGPITHEDVGRLPLSTIS
jgi:hypothetical protein